MGRILLFILLFIAASSLLAAPWITALAYISNSLIQPQYIWPWIFEGIPIYRVTAGLAILGFMFGLAQKKLDLSIYKEKQSLYMVLLWLWMHLSHLLTSYRGAPASVPPELVLSTINSIMIMYFVLLPLCRGEVAVKYLCYVFIAAGLYYTYWANSIYLNQEWYRFINGRLTGPDRSPYSDANVLSTLIVMCMPFIILLVYRVNNIFLKLTILAFIPLLWHALLLFSSRGALLATVITMLGLAVVVKSKKFNIALGLAFTLFIIYQGSVVMNRTTETIETAAIDRDAPVNPRLVSWEAGLKLIPKYPIFGVGVQKFEAATRNHFPGMTPHVAHNTFINFSANTGLVTGLIFLWLLYNSYRRMLMVIKDHDYSLDNIYCYALVASSLGLLGFAVCSLFLDLIIYEPFYILLLINSVSWVELKRSSLNRSLVEPLETRTKLN